MTNQQILDRAQQARIVLENDAYQEGLKLLREQTVRQWKACDVRDREGQMLCLQFSKLADIFEAVMSGMIESGKLAQHRIEIDALRDESKGKRTLRRVFG